MSEQPDVLKDILVKIKIIKIVKLKEFHLVMKVLFEVVKTSF
jgi:hypothetical protein